MFYEHLSSLVLGQMEINEHLKSKGIHAEIYATVYEYFGNGYEGEFVYAAENGEEGQEDIEDRKLVLRLKLPEVLIEIQGDAEAQNEEEGENEGHLEHDVENEAESEQQGEIQDENIDGKEVETQVQKLAIFQEEVRKIEDYFNNLGFGQLEKNADYDDFLLERDDVNEPEDQVENEVANRDEETLPTLPEAIQKLEASHPEIYKKMMDLEGQGLLHDDVCEWYASNVKFLIHID